MKQKLIAIALFAALAGTGAAATAAPAPQALHNQIVAATVAATPDPATQILDMARYFRNNDIVGLAQAMVPESKWEQARMIYEIKRLEPISDKDRAEFEEKIARFTAPDAVDSLMAEIEPQLEEARPKAPGALLMGFGALQMAISSDESELTDEQREALRTAFPSIQSWASSTDFLSSDTMREALTLLTNAARNTGISDIEQLKSLPLESALDRAGTILAAAKQAVDLYGINIDSIVDTLRVDVLDVGGDTARVRTTVTVFNAPISQEIDLVLVEGRWYGKDAASHWSLETAQN